MSTDMSGLFNHQVSRASVHRDTYRVICLLAGILTPVFGVIYGFTDPGAVDPLWMRFGVAFLPLLLLAASYMNRWVQDRFISLVHLLFYLLLAYYVGVTAYNHFSPNYTVGMLFAITAMGVAFSLGLKHTRPVVQYLFASVVFVIPTVFIMTVDPGISPIIISISTLSTAVILYVVARAKIEAEKSMKASEHRYYTLMNSAEDAIFIIDAEEKYIVDANSKAQELTGRSQEELRQMQQSELFPAAHRDRYSGIFTDHAVDNTAVEEDLFITHRTEAPIPVDISASLIKVGDKKLIQGIFRDATQRHQYEKKLVQAKERAEELLQLKSSLLNNMSHELRTPLTGILGFSEVLAEEAPEHMQEHAETVYSSAVRLKKTLNSVLDLAQLESGEAQLEPEVLDVASEVREAIKLLRPLADKKSLDLQVKAVSGEDVCIQADPTCLSRTVNNLVGNAIKFTSDGGVTVTVGYKGPDAYISVRDTGVGIGEEFIDHLFDAFRQESTGLSRSHEGTGLGLTITHRLVELMDGSIEVESEKGLGSVFTVTVPRIRPTQNGSDEFPAEREAAGFPELEETSAHNKLLLVEDNPETQNLVKHRLKDRFEVRCAATPDEALRLAEEISFDGFLLDIGLGTDRDGIDVLNALREFSEYTDAPAVALTAYAMPGDEERFLEAGFDHYLSKPFTKDQLLELIDEVFSPAHESG